MEHEIIDELNIWGILDDSAILNICYNYFCLFDIQTSEGTQFRNSLTLE